VEDSREKDGNLVGFDGENHPSDLLGEPSARSLLGYLAAPIRISSRFGWIPC